MLSFQDIFTSDFFNTEIIKVLTIPNLISYRFVNKTASNMISDDFIKQRICDILSEKLKLIFGQRYTLFLELMSFRKVQIYGKLINEIIWDQVNENSVLHLRMLEADIGTEESNFFSDYLKIDKTCDSIVDSDKGYDHIMTLFRYESDQIKKLSTVNTNIKHIEIHFISSGNYKSYDTYPEPFQNYIFMGNGGLTLNAKNPKNIVNKILPISFTKKPHYVYGCVYQHTLELLKQYNLTYYVGSVPDYIYCDSGYKYPIIIINNNKIIFFGNCYQGSKDASGDYIFDPICINIEDKRYIVSININSNIFLSTFDKPGTYISGLKDILNLTYANIKIKLDDSNGKIDIVSCVCIEYKDSKIFSLQKQIFEKGILSQDEVTINFKYTNFDKFNYSFSTDRWDVASVEPWQSELW
jgi:hypothetical protein